MASTPINRTASFVLAVVLAAAALACSSREKRKIDQVDADEVAQDNEALDQLRTVGSDLTKPHQIDFYLYLPTESDARTVHAALRPMGYGVTISGGENNASWLCLASRTMMPTIKELADARGLFKGLALRHRGAYDGWRAAIVR